MRRDFGLLWRREQVIDTIRAFLKARGLHEVETPLILPTVSTEPYLEVFETELRDDQNRRWRAFLPSSPEYAMKKLLCQGSGSIFTITKSFRNGEGRSPYHNPEFTLLELYQTPGDYWSVASLVEEMVREVNGGKSKLFYQGKEYSLNLPWKRISVAEAFAKYAGIDTATMLNEQWLMAKGREKGYQVSEETTWEEMWGQIMANEVEPRLGLERPTFLYDYPLSQAALAKRAKDPRLAERWELYLAGVELANCFSELSDPQEQERRMRADLAERARMGKTSYPLDQALVAAIEQGLPETGGVALGIDRLAMLVADKASVGEVMTTVAEDLFA